MRTHVDVRRLPPIGSSLLLLSACLLAQLAQAAAPGTVDLLATPPEITASVAPNVALTFDDSGSMAWQYMPDDRPYESPSKEWVQSDPFPRQDSDDWFCAGRIDARVTDSANPRSKPMNGMYYDPNVTYRPPLKADGVSEFPPPRFDAAWNNGIAHNRPTAPVASSTRNLGTSKYCARTHYQLASGSFRQDWSNSGLITSDNNWNSVPYLTGYRGDDDDNNNTNTTGVNPATVVAVGNRTVNVKRDISNPSTYVTPEVVSGNDVYYGVFEVTGGTEIGGNFTIALQPSSRTDNDLVNAPNLVLRLDTTSCTNVTLSYRLRDIDTGSSATQPFAIQVRDKTGDFNSNFTTIRSVANANTGGAATYNDTLATAFNDKRAIEIRWITTNAASNNDAMIGIDDIVVSGTCGTPVVDPPAGAGYFQLKSSVALLQDTFGRITSATVPNLYNPKNWEWVALPPGQQQNFANWYSYYRTRTNSAKTAMSRAFAPFDANIRVAWQNLGFNAKCSVPSFPGCGSVVDAPVFGPTPGTPANTVPDPDVPAIPPTPATPIYPFANPSTARTAFYDWLFQIPARGGTPNIAASIRVGEYFKRAGGPVDTNPYWDRTLDRELSCRQNFHINMSDGFWNSVNVDDPTGTLHEPSGTRLYSNTAIAALPDGRPYTPSASESKIITNYSGTAVAPIMNDIMFHYWATNLRPDFARQNVPPFLPDLSTNLFGIPIASGQDPRTNKEVYWNPANDPASWSHLVNFNISFGLDGTLPNTPEVYTDLRVGTSPTWKWPFPVRNTDDGRKLDDFWHASLSSRGRFLSAKNPEELINSLQEVIASIVARRGASTAVSVSLPIITDGTTGYTAGYDSADWAGFVVRNRLDPLTAERLATLWDAGCILTGGACASTAQTGLLVRDPDSRLIVTSRGTTGTGTAFRWADLSTAQRTRLNVNPTTINLLTNSATADGFGPDRLQYVRGVRTNETTPSPRFRQRSSVLGAVIRGQPIYVSSPTSGYPDTFPAGSPEDTALIAGNSYAAYQVAQRERPPTVYVAANDGMLHAFNGATGTERWAYVPNTVIENFRLTRSTQFEGGFTPNVDDKPLVSDVFINGSWRTVLLGSLRLGGRGVYLLDITDVPASGASETALAGSIPKWEFSNVPPADAPGSDCATGSRFCSSLGYTYESVNIARISYQNKWVALVSSGYFPIDGTDPASNSLKANQTSLLVIDLATGQLIREILTSTSPDAAIQSFGLSQAIVMDTGTDFIDDVAIAGDLAGNLWRFDLSGANPADWKVDLMFTTYGTGGGATVGTSGAVGERPIASSPVVMRDSTGREPIIVFGSGKFIGSDDRTTVIPQQSFYGVEDFGTCSASNAAACAAYPIRPNELRVQKITQTAGIRTIDLSAEPAPANPRGWRIRLDVPAETGERALDTPFPFYSSNQVLLRSVIPKNADPCDPGARYGLMVVDAATGGPGVDPVNPSTSRPIGGVVASSSPPGDPITLRGGGNVVIAGLTERDGAGAIVNAAVVAAINASLSNADDIWHRGAWRDLQQ